MINPRARILQAFKTALDGMTYKSNPVPVFSYPSPGKHKYYIQLGSIITTEEGCKDLFGHECTIDIQVISQFDGNYGTPLDSEAISDLVITRLKETTTSVINVPDFNMVYIVLDNGINDGGLFGTTRTYRAINNFRFYIEEVRPVCPWILETGFWNDAGCWNDTAVWQD